MNMKIVATKKEELSALKTLGFAFLIVGAAIVLILVILYDRAFGDGRKHEKRS